MKRYTIQVCFSKGSLNIPINLLAQVHLEDVSENDRRNAICNHIYNSAVAKKMNVKGYKTVPISIKEVAEKPYEELRHLLGADVLIIGSQVVQ